MERRFAAVYAIAVTATLAALGAALCLPALAAARTLKCGSVTIPVKVTKTIPLTYTDTTVIGVSCHYADTVFLADISAAGSGPPAGWSIRVGSGSGNTIEDTCTRGKDEISFLVGAENLGSSGSRPRVGD